MKTVGFYGGKFLPLHLGHVYMIEKAASMVDELYVILSYCRTRDKKYCDKANMKEITPEIRLRWLGQVTEGMKNVKVIGIEDFYEDYDNAAWEDGANKIKAAIGKPIDYIFSSENSYDDIFKKLYHGAKHIIVDSERKAYPISATKIRTEGVYKNWEYIPKVVRPFFVKKVVVVGTESCGKSTLAKYLANVFNTNYLEEYGRTLYEKYGGVQGGFTSDMYDYIVYEAKIEELKALDEANKILFVDTEAIVTDYYLKLYLNAESKVIDEVIKKQDYDLWLYLEPDVKWIDDGTRLHGEEEARNANNLILKKMLDEHNIKYVEITGTYDERLDKGIELVKKLMAN